MKTREILLPRIVPCLHLFHQGPILFLLAVGPFLCAAFDSSGNTCGLPRLAGDPGVAALNQGAFEIWNGAVDQVGRCAVKITPADQIWETPLRSSGGDEFYVSIALTASAGTEFGIETWKFRLVEPSPTGYFVLEVDQSLSGQGRWLPTGVIVLPDIFDEMRFASVPVLTFRFVRGVDDEVDLYANMTPLGTLRRLARSTDQTQPAIGAGAKRSVWVRGGTHGAWIAGLVQADANPMYLDENRNGIDDDFEHARAAITPPDTGSDIKHAWRKFIIQIGAPVLPLNRPVPQGVEQGRKS